MTYRPSILVVGKSHHLQAAVVDISPGRIPARYEAFNASQFTLPQLLEVTQRSSSDALVAFAASQNDHCIKLFRFTKFIREKHGKPHMRMFVVFTSEQDSNRPKLATYQSHGVEHSVSISSLRNKHEVSEVFNAIINRLLPPTNA